MMLSQLWMNGLIENMFIFYSNKTLSP